MTDPAATDLEPLKKRCSLETKVLIAAVEALRVRNTILTRKNGERAKWASDANARAEASKTQMIELAGAVEALINVADYLTPGRMRTEGAAWKRVNTILAALPTDALERARAREWQPIETAPKDGTYVLTAQPSGFVTILQFCQDEFWRNSCATNNHLSWVPTHWMPLPAPPEDAGT